MVGACVSAVMLVGSALIRADEEKVELDKLPKAVSEAVKKMFPKAKFVSASKEEVDKKTVYELAIKDGEQNIDVTVTPEGEIIEVEKEISVKDLPKDVAAALEKEYPKATIKKTEDITKGKDLKEQFYEVLLVTKDKKTVEVVFDPKGKVVKTEEKKEGEEDKKDEKKDKKDKKEEKKEK
jgi:hypothetical protein